MTTENELIFAKAAKGKSFRARASTDVKPEQYPEAATLVVPGRRMSARHRVFAFATESEMATFLTQQPRARTL